MNHVTHSNSQSGFGSLRAEDLSYARSFVYRTRGGATIRPWESERKTNFYKAGTTLDERTKKIDKPHIRMERQSISGVPFGQPARFKFFLSNDSEAPEAAAKYPFLNFLIEDMTNTHSAKILIDQMPLTGVGRELTIPPGEVLEKIVEVYATEEFDYEGLKAVLESKEDVSNNDEATFSVHFLPAAGHVSIATPGNKWIMNTDAPYDSIRGWYLPVVINDFDKTQRNFDHIELQYKESTRGDDFWTNLCGYYADSTAYANATGTKEMIPLNGNIQARFFGEGKVMEKGYDLRAVLFCRNGNGFLNNSSSVLTGIKDTRRPQVFGTPEPKDGILSAGDNVVFNFSENIEHNYLSGITNFEVKGETNDEALEENISLLFSGNGYAQTEARRNFAGKSTTVEMMIRPANLNADMPLFSHGADGHKLQLWVTKDSLLRAVVDDNTYDSRSKVSFRTSAYRQVALVLDSDAKTLKLYNDSVIGSFDKVTYVGYGPLVFGATNETDVSKRRHYNGQMLQARVWGRAMSSALLNSYGKRLLTGYELGLLDYYPMDDGTGRYAADTAQGAHLLLNGADWAQPRGMSLRLDYNEQRDVKGLKVKSQYLSRGDESDYTLMFWFKTTASGRGALLSNGSGKKTDVSPHEKFFIGFEGEKLKYRSNGREFIIPGSYSDDRWHHYAMTVNRSRKVGNIYVTCCTPRLPPTHWVSWAATTSISAIWYGTRLARMPMCCISTMRCPVISTSYVSSARLCPLRSSSATALRVPAATKRDC